MPHGIALSCRIMHLMYREFKHEKLNGGLMQSTPTHKGQPAARANIRHLGSIGDKPKRRLGERGWGPPRRGGLGAGRLLAPLDPLFTLVLAAFAP
jgi:hypothetical protein